LEAAWGELIEASSRAGKTTLLEQSLEEVPKLLIAVLLKLDQALFGSGLDTLVDGGIDQRGEDLL
jgi:hypothetical protein